MSAGWSVEQNADDGSWEAWSPGREFRVWLDDDGLCIFDVEETQSGIIGVPLGVVDQLRSRDERP